MITTIKRLSVDIHFDVDDRLECFHSDGQQLSGEEPTLIVYNGREYRGSVDLVRDDKELVITIRMHD